MERGAKIGQHNQIQAPPYSPGLGAAELAKLAVDDDQASPACCGQRRGSESPARIHCPH